MTTGIHHVTALTRSVQENVDFYAGFLGLRLVKRTAGFEDAEQLHLFYGDALGSPGSIVSFLVWEDGSPGQTGLGQVSELAFAVPPDAIGEWLTRALSAHIPVEGPLREMGETVLRMKDPDGIIVKLVASGAVATAPLADPLAPARIHSLTILTDNAPAARETLERFGYRAGPQEGTILRMLSQTDAVDIREVSGFPPGIPGAGTVDHLALRAPDAAAVRRLHEVLPDGIGPTNMHDRKYFYSLYLRDAGGVLYEYASDEPGFTVDEPAESLGQALFTPPGNEERSHDLSVMLPQFSMPGEERFPRRNLLFVHRFHTPEDADETVIILLHGSGGNETSLLPLASRVSPRARLIGLRGRATEEGIFRWFRRHGPGVFDQADIRSEAEAFAAFLPDLARLYGFDLSRAIFIGHSNGANFLAAALRLHPDLIQRAILLRAQEVLENPQGHGTGKVLLVQGAADPVIADGGAPLAENLRAAGIEPAIETIDAGHDLVTQDIATIQHWPDLTSTIVP